MPDEILSVREIHRGRRFTFEEISVANRDPAGQPITREIVRHPGAVAVLPVLDDGRYVLIRNYRIAVDDTLWELCAGTLDAVGEQPIECAARELEEETGYRAGRIEPVGFFYTTPGLTDERMYAFAAFDLEPVGQSLEPGEEISVCLKGPDEVDEMIRSGVMVDAKSILTILLYRRYFGGVPGGAGA